MDQSRRFAFNRRARRFGRHIAGREPGAARRQNQIHVCVVAPFFDGALDFDKVVRTNVIQVRALMKMFLDELDQAQDPIRLRKCPQYARSEMVKIPTRIIQESVENRDWSGLDI